MSPSKEQTGEVTVSKKHSVYGRFGDFPWTEACFPLTAFPFTRTAIAFPHFFIIKYCGNSTGTFSTIIGKNLLRTLLHDFYFLKSNWHLMGEQRTKEGNFHLLFLWHTNLLLAQQLERAAYTSIQSGSSLLSTRKKRKRKRIFSRWSRGSLWITHPCTCFLVVLWHTHCTVSSVLPPPERNFVHTGIGGESQSLPPHSIPTPTTTLDLRNFTFIMIVPAPWWCLKKACIHTTRGNSQVPVIFLFLPLLKNFDRLINMESPQVVSWCIIGGESRSKWHQFDLGWKDLLPQKPLHLLCCAVYGCACCTDYPKIQAILHCLHILYPGTSPPGEREEIFWNTHCKGEVILRWWCPLPALLHCHYYTTHPT